MNRVSEVAHRYAEALYEVAKEAGNHAKVFSELRELEKVFKDPTLDGFFFNPTVGIAEKDKVAMDVFRKSKAQSLLVDFISLLIRRNRLFLFKEICEAFEQLSDSEHNVTRGEVRSAAPLSAEERSQVEKTVSRVAGKNVILNYKIDLKVIGGLRAQVGSYLFDDSIDTHLNRLKEELNRRAH